MEIKNSSRKLNIAAGQFNKEREYWKRQLSGELEKSYFPYDLGKITGKESLKQVETFKMDRELVERVKQITDGSFPMIHMILTACIAVLLGKYTGSQDIVVGTPIDRQDTRKALINTILPLRFRWHGNMTFKELLLEVRKIINEAIENQNFPIEILIPDLEKVKEGVGDHDDGFPLFDVMVILENIQDRSYVERFQTGIMFVFRWTSSGMEGEVNYNASLYEENSIKRIVRHYLQLMHTALFDVNLEINDIELLSQGEKDKLGRFNDTWAQYPHQETIHGLFALQVEKTPGNIALVEETSGGAMSYRQLNERADGWADFLLCQGIKRGGIIGIMMELSMEHICAIIAVLKSGCAYLPIDIHYPAERKLYMLEASGVSILLTQRGLTDNLQWNGKILNVEDVDAAVAATEGLKPGTIRVQPGDPAYVIYTSGSTGKPKGVVVEHRAVVNYAWWAAKTYVKNQQVKFPFFTSTAFDLTVTSIFTPLITGNSVVIYQGDNKEFLVEKVFGSNKVEVVKLTPVHLMLMSDQREKDSTIRRLIVGGERLETRLAQKINANFNGNIEIYNEYGPTEAAVGCMIYRFDPRNDNGSSVPIGIPADNVQIYLLNEGKKNVPTGCVGEIYIAGDGLARGYLNRPGLTAERFIPNPFAPGKRMYKTGDRARRLPDGNIEFLGRGDQQVKVRGYRIETGEVEYYLSRYEGVRQAVVLAKDDEKGYKYLVAYIVPSDSTGKMNANGLQKGNTERDINVEELRNYLARYLPDFMIPSYFMVLDKLQVTVNGKIDRKALPLPNKNALDTGTPYQPPTTELEKTMVGIWQEVMGIETVGIDDTYFALGGDSIKAIQISARLQKLKLRLELKDLFQYSTIRELASHIKPLKEIIPQRIVKGEVKLTPIQKWFFDKQFSEEHHFNQSVLVYRAEGFREDIIKKVFNELTKHHDALRIIFRRENGKIKQINRGFAQQSEWVKLEVFDISKDSDHEKAIREICSRVQSSIDLSRGPLVKLGLFKTVKGDYLVIVIHHLVFDGLSWRIMFEDFTSLYTQMEKGVPEKNWEIPLKTNSYKEWAEKLYEYANSEELIKELEYWQQLDKIESFPLFKNNTNPKGKVKDSGQLSFELPEEYTEKLLKKVNSAYNTEINDILLTALGQALSDWTGAKQIPIILEGHGREEIIPEIDITRTVGWFTSIYPVVLDMSKKHDMASVIKNTKEMLRAVPRKGIGYGILRYLTREEKKRKIEFRLKPEISFNYLGQFDEDINSEFFQVADISAGDAISLNLERIYTLYIEGLVFKGKLRMSVNYDTRGYHEKEIGVLMNGYEVHLRQIIDHCTAREETEFTLSDYSAAIDEQEAEQVIEILREIVPDG